MSSNQKTFSVTPIVLAIIFTLTVVRLLVAKYTGLGVGEAYYFRGAYQVSLSYFDQPPLFFWISHLSMKIFGINCLGIRIPDVLLFSGTTWVLFLISKHFFDQYSGLFTVILFNLSALYVIDGIWYQPDAPLLFFWALSLYFAIKLLFPKEPLNKTTQLGLWILLGLSMGLTGLSKYHVVFFIVGLILFILTKHRKVLNNSGLYIALIICGICFLPVIIWNYQHDWISIKFQGSREFTDNFKLHFDWFFRSFAGQALWLLPWIWIPIVFEFVRSFKLGIKTDDKYWFFFCMALFPVVFFTASTLWADYSYHFHWQSVGYMILFVPLGATIAKLWNTHKKRWLKIWLFFSGVFLYGFITVGALQIQTGFWQTYGPKKLNQMANPTLNKDQLIDPTMDGYDYTDLYKYFEQKNLFNQTNLFVGASNWLLAGKVDWALKGRIAVRSFEEQRNYMYYFDDKKYIGDNLIFITRDPYTKALDDTKNNCSNLKLLDNLNIKRSGRTELVLHLYTCNNFTS